jgi:hypothetical protein
LSLRRLARVNTPTSWHDMQAQVQQLPYQIPGLWLGVTRDFARPVTQLTSAVVTPASEGSPTMLNSQGSASPSERALHLTILLSPRAAGRLPETVLAATFARRATRGCSSLGHTGAWPVQASMPIARRAHTQEQTAKPQQAPLASAVKRAMALTAALRAAWRALPQTQEHVLLTVLPRL